MSSKSIRKFMNLFEKTQLVELSEYLNKHQYGQWLNSNTMKTLDVPRYKHAYIMSMWLSENGVTQVHTRQGPVNLADIIPELKKHHVETITGGDEIYEAAYNQGWIRLCYEYGVGMKGNKQPLQKILRRLLPELLRYAPAIDSGVYIDIADDEGRGFAAQGFGLPALKKFMMESKKNNKQLLELREYLNRDQYGQWLNVSNMKSLDVKNEAGHAEALIKFWLTNGITECQGIDLHDLADFLRFHIIDEYPGYRKIYNKAFSEHWVRTLYDYDEVCIEGNGDDLKKAFRRLLPELLRGGKAVLVDVADDESRSFADIDGGILPKIKQFARGDVAESDDMSLIKELNDLITEGDLIPMPQHAIYMPNSSYEWYRMLQHLVDPSKKPTNHLMCEPHTVLFATSDSDKEKIQNALKAIDMAFSDDPKTFNHFPLVALQGNTNQTQYKTYSDNEMKDVINQGIYNDDNRPNQKPLIPPPSNNISVPKGADKNRFSKQGKGKPNYDYDSGKPL